MSIISSWDSITIDQFQEIFLSKPEDFNTYDEYNIFLVSVLQNISIDEVEEMELEEYNKQIRALGFLKNIPKINPSQSVYTTAGQLYLIDNLEGVTIGEFIDLENLVTTEMGHIKNIKTILSILYRRKLENINPILYVDDFEQYGNWIFHRQDLFDNIKVKDVYGVINMYTTFRSKIFDAYSGLFSEEVYEEEKEGYRTKREKTNEENKNKKWGWNIILLQLAQNDVLKIEQVTKLPLIQGLNTLAMIKELNIQL